MFSLIYKIASLIIRVILGSPKDDRINYENLKEYSQILTEVHIILFEEYYESFSDAFSSVRCSFLEPDVRYQSLIIFIQRLLELEDFINQGKINKEILDETSQILNFLEENYNDYKKSYKREPKYNTSLLRKILNRFDRPAKYAKK